MTRFTLLLAVAVALATGCATDSSVTHKQQRLSTFLQQIEAPAMVCAPRKLAEARANLDFAQYEAAQGQTMRAKAHLVAAEQGAREAWERSRGPECEGDQDLDGIRDSVDKCPTEPEDYDGDRDEDGCPDYDRDGDGLDDEHDRCPDDPEDKDGFEDDDGCPDKDNDKDGIADADDRCPQDPEDKDGFEDADGCPDPDNDQDGIPDTLDRCPLVPENINGFEDEDGCRDEVPKPDPVVAPPEENEYEYIVPRDGRIDIRDKIYFAYRKFQIRARSFGLLDEIVDYLTRKQPDIRVRIEGHTDSRGKARKNRWLSKKRAQAVRAYLASKGVDGERLEAVGHGEDKPKCRRRSKVCHKKNRRVEFHIVP